MARIAMSIVALAAWSAAAPFVPSWHGVDASHTPGTSVIRRAVVEFA